MSNVNRELLQAMIEQKKHQLSDSDHIMLHGYKVFVSHQQGGQISLLELVEQSSLSAQEIIAYLIEGGMALLKLHQTGYIYNAFTLEQVVYDLRRKKIELRDHALKLSLEQGKQGIYNLLGSPGYVHPLWLMRSRKDFLRGKRVKYSTKNDVYAFLRVAEHLFKRAALRTHNPNYVARLREAREQIHRWKESLLDELPSLYEVLTILKAFEYESPQVRAVRGKI